MDEENYQREENENRSRLADIVEESGKKIASRAFNNLKSAGNKAIKKGLGKLATAAAPFLAKVGLIIGASVAIILALAALLLKIFITILLWTVGFTLFVIFVLFIINSGAYMVPPGENLTSQLLFTDDTQCQGDSHPECPCGWPVRIDTGQRYRLTQGPQVSPILTSCSHQGLEAIDLSSGEFAVDPNDIIVATHNGTITNIAIDGNGGLWISIQGTCNGTVFTSMYVHFDSWNPNLNIGQTITRGTPLGIMGTTGFSTAPHVHYEFWGDNPRMAIPNLPMNPQVGCCGFDDCGSIVVPATTP